MSKSLRKHPKFDRPPVVETVFGVEFAPLLRFQVPYFGLYWTEIRDRYPKSRTLPAVGSVLETLETRLVTPGAISLSYSEIPPIRCWFFNREETQLIQIQQDRFIFNWKRGLVEEAYPRYENIRPVMAMEWERFNEFVITNDLGICEIRQCEINYINHIEKGAGWKDYGEFGELLTLWSGKTRCGVLPTPEDVDLNLRYRLPDGSGRMYVHFQPAIRNEDGKEITQLTLTARGRPASSDLAKILDWFDSSQRWLAESFADIITDKMQDYWGRGDDI